MAPEQAKIDQEKLRGGIGRLEATIEALAPQKAALIIPETRFRLGCLFYTAHSVLEGRELVSVSLPLGTLLTYVAGSVDNSKGGSVEVELEVPEQIAHLVVPNAFQLYRSLCNLVKNAVEAIRESGQGSVVRISADRDCSEQIGEGLRFIVRDDGPGLPKDIA